MDKERALLQRAQEIVDTVKRNQLRKYRADREAHDGMMRITHEDIKFLLTRGLTQAFLSDGMSISVMLEIGRWVDDPAPKSKSVALPAALVVKALLVPPRLQFCVGHAPRFPIQGTASDSNEQAVKSVARQVQVYDYVDEGGPISSAALRTLRFRVPKNKDPGSMPKEDVYREASRVIAERHRRHSMGTLAEGDRSSQYEKLMPSLPFVTESINDAIVLDPAYMPPTKKKDK